jgi:hypothetical protein
MIVESNTPNNTVLFDDKGNPSVMVRIPKFSVSDVLEGGSEKTHPAFIVQEKEINEIYISKFSNIIVNGRACSLPSVSPDTEVIYDNAKLACDLKGKGWHMMSNAEWAAMALWCKKNGFLPRGNNAFGKDVTHPYERGVVTLTYENQGVLREGKTATGTGPVSWAHDNSPAGIYDVNGNVWTQVTGLRFFDGEIQIIQNNDSAANVDESTSSIQWKAVLPSGELVKPGTNGTVKFDEGDGKQLLTEKISVHGDKWQDSLFGDLKSTVLVPESLKSLALFPADNEGFGEQKLWYHNTGERMPWRGGTWDAFSNAGVFCLFACYPRNHISKWLGFRSAFINL